jgi:hypothetical protein
MGAAMIELNPNYPGKKQKKYNVYTAEVIDMQPVGKGDTKSSTLTNQKISPVGLRTPDK